MIVISTWRERLDRMNQSKGVSNKMVQQAMRSEIGALRTALRTDTILRKQRLAIGALNRKLAIEKTRVEYWRKETIRTRNIQRYLNKSRERCKQLLAYTRKYQKQIAELQK